MNKKILIASIFATLMLLVPMTSVVGVISKNVTMDNQPPNPPEISGPNRGKVGVAYEFSFVTTDPDGDNVSYYIDWDDGNITNWTAFQPSGYPGYSESHTWTKKGIYFVRCKANDTHGAESDWGIHYGIIVGTKTVTYVTVDNQPSVEDCGCQPVSNHNFDRLEKLSIRIERLLNRAKIFTNILGILSKNNPEISKEKFEELSNRITTLKEINENLNLYNPNICLALFLMFGSVMGIFLFYQEIAFAFELMGFEGIAGMFYLLGLKYFALAVYIKNINDDLGCSPIIP